MAQALRAVEDEPAENALVVQVTENPGLVLLDRERFNQFYEAVKAETDKLVPDTSSAKGRKEIASMARKVASMKVQIDDAGKKLNEEARARINLVDAARRDIRDKLDALKDDVRRPLTEWEAAEEQRLADVKAWFERTEQAANVWAEDTAAAVAERIAQLEQETLNPDVFQDTMANAQATVERTLTSLRAAHARLVQEEADRAELERLRREAAEREERERQEAEAKAAAEAEERARQEAVARAERAAAEEKARIEAAAKAAEEAARIQAERKAQAEREAADRAHAEALAAEKRRADEAEAARKAEEDRIAREKADAERRAADIAHRGKIMGEAKTALMDLDLPEATAKAVVLAIAAGNVPHVSISF